MSTVRDAIRNASVVVRLEETPRVEDVKRRELNANAYRTPSGGQGFGPEAAKVEALPT
jgi:hypothetical protein